MAIPKIKSKDIIDALKYIDDNGVPFHNLIRVRIEMMSGQSSVVLKMNRGKRKYK